MEEVVNPKISTEARIGYTVKANQWSAKGGLISHLMKTEPGFREFFHEEIMKKSIPVGVFIARMREKFPKLDEEMYPCEATVYNYKRKLKKDLNDDANIGLAMKSEIKILQTMDGFNFFEEVKDIYDKICFSVDIAEKAIAHIVDLMERTKLPPQPLWDALLNMKELLKARSEHLSELDKLSVRFGLMPAREERNIIFAQQNNIMTMNDEQVDVMGKIGLKVEDFEDDNLEKTMSKVMGYYSKTYGIGEQQSGAILVEGQSVQDDGPEETLQPDEDIGNDSPNGENKTGREEEVVE